MFTTQPIATTSKTQPPAPPHRGDVSMVTPDHVDPTAAIQSSGSNPPVAVSQQGKRKAAKKKGKKKKKAKKCYESTLSQLVVSDLELISDSLSFFWSTVANEPCGTNKLGAMWLVARVRKPLRTNVVVGLAVNWAMVTSTWNANQVNSVQNNLNISMIISVVVLCMGNLVNWHWKAKSASA
jgi:hypothetical protein